MAQPKPAQQAGSQAGPHSGTPPGPMVVHHRIGSEHGFLVLRSQQGKTLAAGELIEIVRGDEVKAHLAFRFRDGSVDEDTTVYSQAGTFHLISDHHVQKGPSYPKPSDVTVNIASGQVKVVTLEDGKEKVVEQHMDLPPEVANGLLFTVLTNIKPDPGVQKIAYVANTSKPRLVHMAISAEGEDSFSVAGTRHRAQRFVVKVELGGVAGVVAPLVGKQPTDTHIWIIEGQVPTLARVEGALYEGGPIWEIEQTSPVWTYGRPGR